MVIGAGRSRLLMRAVIVGGFCVAVLMPAILQQNYAPEKPVISMPRLSFKYLGNSLAALIGFAFTERQGFAAVSSDVETSRFCFPWCSFVLRPR